MKTEAGPVRLQRISEGENMEILIKGGEVCAARFLWVSHVG